MTTRGEDLPLVAARMSLESLERHASVLREEVSGLQSVLAGLRGATAHPLGDMAEANGYLLEAALAAQVLAEDAGRERDRAALASQRDALTDTPNRAAMLDLLRAAIVSAGQRGTQLAVLFIDIDAFKRINDTFGHAVGDGVLRCVAGRLGSAVRQSDAVGRFGGEEFLVLLDDLATTDGVVGVVKHLLEVMAQPETIGGYEIALSASLGIALYPDDALDAEALIACSDAAMYRAKRRGPGGYEFCHDIARDAAGARQMPALAGVSEDPGRGVRLDGTRHADLQEANGRLVAWALQAQADETRASDARDRQLRAMAMAAHELRNPLAPIRIAAGMLDRVRDNPVQLARLQEIIDSQVTLIARLVDDLLDGSRVAVGKLRVQHADADLTGVLEAALRNCRPSMAARHQRLDCDLPPEGTLPVHADHVRLVQVFTNLLDNASKYTQEGGRIALAVAQADGSVVVSVRDNGIGIPAEALPHVFDLFVQDTSAIEARKEGLGIGLALVRELVDAHGGTVVGTSAGRGLGSTFVVTLPMDGATGDASPDPGPDSDSAAAAAQASTNT